MSSRSTYPFTRIKLEDWKELNSRAQFKRSLQIKIDFGSRWVSEMEYEIKCLNRQLEHIAIDVAVRSGLSVIKEPEMLDRVVEIYRKHWGFGGASLAAWYEEHGHKLRKMIELANSQIKLEQKQELRQCRILGRIFKNATMVTG